MSQSQKTAHDGYDWSGRKLKGIEVGDVFSLPLPDGSFAFGRVLNAHDGATVAEFFRARRDTPEFDPSVLESGRLIAPTGILFDGIEYRNRKRDWKVVAKDPDFYPDDLYDWKFVRSPDGRDNWEYYTLYDVWTMKGRASNDDVKNWRFGTILPQHPGRLRDVIAEQLEKQGL